MNKQFDWKNIKKTDWIVLALIGAILLVIVLPEGNGSTGNTALWKKTEIRNTETVVEEREEMDAEFYTSYLEKKLEGVLREMEGVGRVKVMITLSDNGQSIVEKDMIDVSNTVKETDSSGGSRDTFSSERTVETVQVEDENGTYPYVGKEILPTIEGIVVVAEGGGNATVVSQISKAAMALFPIEAHKIIVVKMSKGG
ncbi:MAG: stage III sporulation protein AG [Roseburia sp.]|nr:stage III sporulation protein AG [Roseburia sp.]